MDEKTSDVGQPDEPSLPHPDDARWEALARHLAGEARAEDDVVVREWIESHPTDAAAVTALDQTLDRLAFTAPADLDVEGALRRVRAKRVEPTSAAEVAADASAEARVIPFPRPTVAPVAAPHAPGTRSSTRFPAAASSGRWTPLRAVGAIAASVAVLAGGVAIWRANRGETPAARTYATAVGQRDSLQLIDGTRVILGPRTSLEVPADFGTEGADRTVRLRGDALFTVHHDATRAFRVVTPSAVVRDVGTTFVVRAGDADGVAVTVQEGAVQLSAATAATDAGVTLRAGDRGVVRPGGRAVAQPGGAAASDDVACLRWDLAFRDAAVSDVATTLRRCYGLELRLADSTLGARHFTAVFHGEPADEVVRVLGLALGAMAERHGDTVVVRAAPAPGAPTSR